MTYCRLILEWALTIKSHKKKINYNIFEKMYRYIY